MNKDTEQMEVVVAMSNLKTGIKVSDAELPWYQQMVLRLMVPYVAGKDSQKDNASAFIHLNTRILDLVDQIPLSQRSVRVMVPPQIGLENNCRYWSVAMTLEHLLLAGERIRSIIFQLAEGGSFQKGILMSDFEPSLTPDTALVAVKYRKFVSELMPELDELLIDVDLSATHDHPWFGPFHALQWHWLLASHSAIHWRQLQNIRIGLDPNAH